MTLDDIVTAGNFVVSMFMAGFSVGLVKEYVQRRLTKRSKP
jgi:dihydroxyacetone kinase